MTVQDEFYIRPDVCGLELTFKTCKNAHNFLLLNNLDLTNYVVFANDYMPCYTAAQVSIPGYIKRSFIIELIEHEHFLESLVLNIYPKNVAPSQINTYQEYKVSQCEMIILMYDMLNIEVYAKKKTWLLQLLNNAYALKAVKVVFKTEETDGRMGMYV